MWVSCPIVPAPFASLCSEPAVPTEGSSRTGSWICWMLSRAGTCSKELFRTQNPAGFSRRVVWSGPCLAPTAREPRQRQQHKQVWAALGQRSSRGIGVTAGQGSGKEPNLGLSMIQPLTCVCVWLLPGANTDPGPSRALPPFPARGEGWERHQTPRTLFQGEKCPFLGLWSLSGILGKFFLVKDSPPLPCSGRCLYGAFQVPEELWEDFLFPFCYMAESQMSLGQSQEDLISPLKP